MKTDLFIRSYHRDFEWLRYCLASIERYCRGFGAVIVVTPRSSEPWLRRVRASMPGWVRFEVCEDYADDYLGQQVTKLHADAFTDADLICHVDSDCIFERLTTPDDVAPLGRPRVYTHPTATLPRHWPWTAPTASFMGETPTHDFMQCPPFVFPRWLYGRLRAFCVARHGVSLGTWVLSCPARGFSEFNALGAYAHAHHPEQFVWVRSIDIGEAERSCRWYCSWDRIDAATRRELEALTAHGDGHG